MTDLQAIATLYEEIDNILKSLRGTLPAAGENADPIPRTTALVTTPRAPGRSSCLDGKAFPFCRACHGRWPGSCDGGARHH